MAVQDGRDPGTDAYEERMRRMKRKRRATKSAARSKKSNIAGEHRKPNRAR